MAAMELTSVRRPLDGYFYISDARRSMIAAPGPCRVKDAALAMLAGSGP